MGNGGSTCQYCGKDCGNAGARSNHEDACNENPGSQGAQRSAEIERAQPQADAVPARDGSQGAAETAGDLLFTITHGDDLPREAKRDAVNEGIGLLGSIARRYNELRFRNEEMKEQRAQKASLERAVEYPECKDCGYPFGAEDIGTDDQVRCPECGALWNITVEEEGAEAAG